MFDPRRTRRVGGAGARNEGSFRRGAFHFAFGAVLSRDHGARVGKDHSLARLLAHLGLSREQLIAFGDGFNDLAMLRFAGMGVAMANAADEVKAVADRVTLSNDEDGVAHAVAQWVLG